MTLLYRGHVIEADRRMVQKQLDAMSKEELACGCGDVNAFMAPHGSMFLRTYFVEAKCHCGMVSWSGEMQLKKENS